jgi:serpin B
MRRVVLIVTVVVVLAAAAAVAVTLVVGRPAPASAQPLKGSADPHSASARALATPLDTFGLALLKQEAAASPSGNVVVSPVSLHAVLSMVLNGAAGRTAEQMRRVLGLTAMTPKEANQGWADLIWLAQSGKKHEVSIADSLWLRDGVPFRPTFLDTNRDYYAAATNALPTDPTQAADQINAWVEQHTAGKIKELVTAQMFDSQTILALINTVHLKVQWRYFDKAETRPEPFTLASGAQVDVPMMQAHVTAPVYQGKRYDAVALKTDGPVTAWVIVPKGSETADALAASLDARQLEAMYAGAPTTEAGLALPRFTTTYSADHLKDDLSVMGMPRAFSPDQAEFPGIADVGLNTIYIQRAVQKTFIDLNEQGVEAAAGSGLIMGLTSAPANPLTIRADRPFLLVLTESATKAPLFMGLVRDPR